MKLFIKFVCAALSVMLFAASVSAGALIYPSSPSTDAVQAAAEAKNFPKPKNLRVVSTTKDSVTVSWKYEDWGYSLAYTTDSDEEPEFKPEVNVRTTTSTEDWAVTVNDLTPGKTYYIYVKHAAIDVVNMWPSYLSGECSMVKVRLKANNTLTVKTADKSLAASSLKKANKTVKPVSISKAKGDVKVVKVKSGTNSKIYGKITVNKKTGAITFKKGAYKKGTYKVKLKITVAGNSDYKSKTLNKTVTIKIK